MTDLTLTCRLEPMGPDHQAFAEDLAEDLQGGHVEVVQLVSSGEYHLAERDRHDTGQEEDGHD